MCFVGKVFAAMHICWYRSINMLGGCDYMPSPKRWKGLAVKAFGGREGRIPRSGLCHLGKGALQLLLRAHVWVDLQILIAHIIPYVCNLPRKVFWSSFSVCSYLKKYCINSTYFSLFPPADGCVSITYFCFTACDEKARTFLPEPFDWLWFPPLNLLRLGCFLALSNVWDRWADRYHDSLLSTRSHKCRT